MINLLYIFLGIIGFVYFYSFGVYFVAKKLDYPNPKEVFIPFNCFRVMSKLIGVFTIFTIPVKKYLETVIIFVVVILLSCLYGFWGDINLPIESSEPLWQIMWVVIGLSILSLYAGLLSSTSKLYLKFKLENTALITFLSALVLPLPFIYIYLSKKDLRVI